MLPITGMFANAIDTGKGQDDSVAQYEQFRLLSAKPKMAHIRPAVWTSALACVMDEQRVDSVTRALPQ